MSKQLEKKYDEFFGSGLMQDLNKSKIIEFVKFANKRDAPKGTVLLPVPKYKKKTLYYRTSGEVKTIKNIDVRLHNYGEKGEEKYEVLYWGTDGSGTPEYHLIDRKPTAQEMDYFKRNKYVQYSDKTIAVDVPKYKLGERLEWDGDICDIEFEIKGIDIEIRDYGKSGQKNNVQYWDGKGMVQKNGYPERLCKLMK
jgi:hypothetical protein